MLLCHGLLIVFSDNDTQSITFKNQHDQLSNPNGLNPNLCVGPERKLIQVKLEEKEGGGGWVSKQVLA